MQKIRTVSDCTALSNGRTGFYFVPTALDETSHLILVLMRWKLTVGYMISRLCPLTQTHFFNETTYSVIYHVYGNINFDSGKGSVGPCRVPEQRGGQPPAWLPQDGQPCPPLTT